MGSEDVTLWSRYTDVCNSQLYPFGYGLSYTTFEYSNLNLSDSFFIANSELTIKVNLKNSGTRYGEEVDSFTSAILEVVLQDQ